jgi:hypothetical protein
MILSSLGTLQEMPEGTFEGGVVKRITGSDQAGWFDPGTRQEQGIGHFSKHDAGGEGRQW